MNEPAPPTEADLDWLADIARNDFPTTGPLARAVLYLLDRDQEDGEPGHSAGCICPTCWEDARRWNDGGAAGGEGEEAAHMVERLLADALERERAAHQALRTGVQQEIRQYERSTAMPGRGRYNIVAGLARLLDPPDPA